MQPTPSKLITQAHRDVELPRVHVRLLYTIPNSETMRPAREFHNNWVESLSTALPLDEFGEGSRQIITSARNEHGETSSLHVLSTGEAQTLHMHIPPTREADVNTHIFEEPTSHRFLYVLTGAQEGSVEWFMPDDKMTLGHNSDGLPYAKGGASKYPRYTMKIPPYSAALVEMQGGVHNFKHVAAYSYHMQNAANTATDKDDLRRNTFQWSGDAPSHVVSLEVNGTDIELLSPQQVITAKYAVYDLLRYYAQKGSRAALDSSMTDDILRAAFGHDLGTAGKIKWHGNGAAFAQGESTAPSIPTRVAGLLPCKA